jgi:hypothetical protein
MSALRDEIHTGILPRSIVGLESDRLNVTKGSTCGSCGRVNSTQKRSLSGRSAVLRTESLMSVRTDALRDSSASVVGRTAITNASSGGFLKRFLGFGVCRPRMPPQPPIYVD